MKDLGIYVHIPFCIKKCPYCDFNSHSLQNFLPLFNNKNNNNAGNNNDEDNSGDKNNDFPSIILLNEDSGCSISVPFSLITIAKK